MSCSVLDLGPQGCAVGYYQPNTGQGSCIECPAGNSCLDLTYSKTNLGVRPVECPAGFYCPAQSNSVSNAEIPCPAGTYSSMTGLGSEDECVECPPGKYCTGGLAEPDDDCDAGHFCPKG